MKKSIVAITAMLSLSLSVMAQQENHFAQGDAQKQPPSREQMAQERTDRMVKEYGLNKKQAAKLLDLNKEYASKFPNPRPGGPRRGPQAKSKTDGTTAATKPAPDQQPQAKPGQQPSDKAQQPKGVRMSPERERQIHQAYNAELQKIMTKKQYAKYEQNMKAQRGGRHGNGPKPQQ